MVDFDHPNNLQHTNGKKNKGKLKDQLANGIFAKSMLFPSSSSFSFIFFRARVLHFYQYHNLSKDKFCGKMEAVF